MTQPTQDDAVRELVRTNYGQVASTRSSCCGATTPNAPTISKDLGYSEGDLASVPDSADLGLGCGNPTALANLAPGETVLDLGSGGGLDAFLAAKQVGETGRVIGVDMTPEMLELARTNAVKTGLARRVEFREGIIEALPVVDQSVDVIISNCVINLSPDKRQVFREAFRVLKPGGRLAVSDILLSEALPEAVTDLAEAYVGCVSGALLADDYLGLLKEVGFEDVTWTRTSAACMFSDAVDDPIAQKVITELGSDKIREVLNSVWSYKIEAHKPK